MILIERFNRHRRPTGCRCTRGVIGVWEKAWQGDDWDDEARELVQAFDYNGDPWRSTFHSEQVRQ